MAQDSGSPDAIQKTIIVRCNLEKAFRAWTEQIDLWWPKGHSRSGDPRTTVVLERRLGGRLYERTLEGVEYAWGQVIAWDSPRHFAFHWYLHPSARKQKANQIDDNFLYNSPGSHHQRSIRSAAPIAYRAA